MIAGRDGTGLERRRGAVTVAPLAIGVDGCRAGWIAAAAFSESSIGAATSRGRPGAVRTELRLYDKKAGGLAALVAECEAMSQTPVVAVDVPIGLPRRAGLRDCDRQARSALGRRWPCVFPTPDRELLGLSFEEARTLVLQRRTADPQGRHPVMTKQAMAIAPKIAEADVLLSANAARQGWLVEVHPELSFLALARSLTRPEAKTGLPRKKRAAGRALRVSLITASLPDAPHQLSAVAWNRADVGRDDVLDAYAGLWSALRFARHDRDLVVYGGLARDEARLLMQMIT
jgi:predicted RNase H-like nuclease